MVISGPHERRRRNFVGGPGAFSPGKFEKLDCLRLHFVRSEGKMRHRKANEKALIK